MVINSKLRRHSGRVTPRTIGRMKRSEVIDQGLEPQIYWDDWKNYRDSFRGCDDRKMLRDEHMFAARSLDVKRWNKKIRQLIARRKVKLRVRKSKHLHLLNP